jgi:hypothetical protein
LWRLSARHTSASPATGASGCYRNVKYLTIIALNANGKPPFALPSHRSRFSPG